MTMTYILRLWMPDRPGALGQVASRVGAVGGDVVGIDILERGAGRAIDELVVELPEDGLVDLLIAEMHQVDGVDVESITPAADSLRDPRLDALETAAILVGASTQASALEELCVHSVRTVGAVWAAVIELGIQASMRWSSEHPELYNLFAFAATEERFAPALRKGQATAVSDAMRHVQAGIDAGTIREGDPNLIAHAILGVTSHLARRFVHEEGQPWQDVADGAVAFCLEGLLVPTAVPVAAAPA